MAEITIADITMNDILLGRGKRIHAWPGNVEFRRLVAERCRSYHLNNFSKERCVIALEVFEQISTKGGRFLRPWNRAPENATTTEFLGATTWIEIGRTGALRKIKQALRDSGAKVIASENGTWARKKGRKKSADIQKPDPLNTSQRTDLDLVGGASVFPGYSRRGGGPEEAVVNHELFQNQELAFRFPLDPLFPALAADLRLATIPSASASLSLPNQYPVALLRSYTQPDRQTNLFQTNGTRFGSTPTPGIAQHHMSTTRSSSGEERAISQLPSLSCCSVGQIRPNINATSMDSTSQQLNVEQSSRRIPYFESLTPAEVQLIDEALSLGEDSLEDISKSAEGASHAL